MSRIELHDSLVTAVVKMSEGNPGAMAALRELITNVEAIDPHSALGTLGPILSLDSHGIYGSGIYVLYSDKCGRDVRKMIVLLRSVQLGLLPESKLKAMAEDQAYRVNLTSDEFTELDLKVCERLAQFKKPEDTVDA